MDFQKPLPHMGTIDEPGGFGQGIQETGSINIQAHTAWTYHTPAE